MGNIKMLGVLACLFMMVACQRLPYCYTAYYGPIEYDPAIRPKQIIETSHLRTVIEKDYKVRVDYLDCFRFDTTEEGTVRFFSKDDDLQVRMVMFVEPNVEGWTIEEAVINLIDSCTEDIEMGKNYFIFSGNLGDSSLMYLEKCYLIDDKWIVYTMFYRRENEGAVNRMANIIIDWCPIEESDIIANPDDNDDNSGKKEGEDDCQWEYLLVRGVERNLDIIVNHSSFASSENVQLHSSEGASKIQELSKQKTI